MTDRELLELAAKAAGIEAEWKEWRTARIGTFGVIQHNNRQGFWVGKEQWNPLTNDGDALRLAVKIKWVPSRVEFEKLAVQDDPCAATRRAIVRAAAGIGRNMK